MTIHTADNRTFTLRPASEPEAGLFFAQTPEQDRAMGIIGHIRMDFGRSGKEFWHTWHPRGPQEWNTPVFSDELNSLVDELRKNGPLKDMESMRRYCREHGGAISGGWVQNYGYVAESECYRYYLRCNPVRGDYNVYLTCQAKEHDTTRGKGSNEC